MLLLFSEVYTHSNRTPMAINSLKVHTHILILIHTPLFDDISPHAILCCPPPPPFSSSFHITFVCEALWISLLWTSEYILTAGPFPSEPIPKEGNVKRRIHYWATSQPGKPPWDIYILWSLSVPLVSSRSLRDAGGCWRLRLTADCHVCCYANRPTCCITSFNNKIGGFFFYFNRPSSTSPRALPGVARHLYSGFSQVMKNAIWYRFLPCTVSTRKLQVNLWQRVLYSTWCALCVTSGRDGLMIMTRTQMAGRKVWCNFNNFNKCFGGLWKCHAAFCFLTGPAMI